jgi:hypothetical protein
MLAVPTGRLDCAGGWIVRLLLFHVKQQLMGWLAMMTD